MIASPQPLIEPEADGFLVRFSVDASPDVPDRCFKALWENEITTRSLSILREKPSERRLSVTLRAGRCSAEALQSAIRHIVRPRGVASQHADAEGNAYLCGVP